MTHPFNGEKEEKNRALEKGGFLLGSSSIVPFNALLIQRLFTSFFPYQLWLPYCNGHHNIPYLQHQKHLVNGIL